MKIKIRTNHCILTSFLLGARMKLLNLLAIGSVLMGLLSSCGNYTWIRKDSVASIPYEMNVQNIDLIKSNDSIVIYNPWRRYSPDGKHYIDYEFKSFPGCKHGRLDINLYDSNAGYVGKVKHVSPFEDIFWFNDFIVLSGLKYNNSIAPSGKITLGKDRKILFEFHTGEKKRHKTIGSFVFIGQSSEKAYFETLMDNQKIENISFPHKHSVISVAKNGVLSENSYNTSPYHLFKNSFFSIDFENEKISASYKNQPVPDFKTYNTPFSSSNDSYFSNDTSFLCFNNSDIYQITSSNLTKLFNFNSLNKNLKIHSFIITNHKIYFLETKNINDDFKQNQTLNSVRLENIGTNKEFYEIGLIDLKSKKLIYPLLKIN